jgi:hypothetical protein
MTFTAANLNTTLVLEPAAADFSTDAGNSALIVATKSPRCLLAPITACLAAKKKTINEISIAFGSPGRERNVTKEAHSTTICSRYRTVIRRADHRTLHSWR